MFNPAIKVSDIPQKEKKVLPVSEDKEDLSFKLFEQAEKETPAEKGWDKQDLTTVRYYSVMPQQQIFFTHLSCL